MSFAYLVFASAWFKRYHPAAFCTALINSQPMGFYSVQSLADDARRHGVVVRGPDINASGVGATLEPPVVAGGPRNGWNQPSDGWGVGGPVVRLGLSQVRTIGDALAERIEAERTANGPYRDLRDLARRVAGSSAPARATATGAARADTTQPGAARTGVARTGAARRGAARTATGALTTANLEALATAGAFTSWGLSRREALWAAGAAAQERPDRLPGTTPGCRAPTLPGMDEIEEMVADVWSMGLSPDSHPVQFVRTYLTSVGALPLSSLAEVEPGTRILVGGVVTHRQRPATAGGITFVNLEDETGMLNVVCSAGFWQRYRRIARTASALLVRGRVERVETVVNLVADHLATLRMPVRSASRDFR
jgi:error-prone DNA polymerase